jgi:hypothetical protein
MDRSEASRILSEKLARFGSYSDVVPLAESRHIETLEVRGAHGATYQIEVQFLWDDKQSRSVRVVGSIDDGGIRAFFPLTETLLVSPPKSAKT